MSKRRASQSADAIALFPFLAVLLCTMGGLLVLLVVLSEAAKRLPVRAEPVAVAAADPAEAERAAALLVALKDVQGKQQQLDELSRQAEQRLANEQDRLAHSEAQHRQLEQELSKLYLALKQLSETENDQVVDRTQAERELKRLEELIVDTEEQLEDLREQEGKPKSYAIVPFRGEHGTYRRPIYIECTESAVIIQPEGIRLSAQDFVMADRAGNPLASAIRAARERLNNDARAAGSDEMPNAYPLLLVRPEGKQAYLLVQRAIQAWDGDYGYEFVDSDWNLEFPPLDPVLADVMNHAVYQSRQRMAALAAAAPNRFNVRLVGVAGAEGVAPGGSGGGGGGYATSSPGGRGFTSGFSAESPLVDSGLFNREAVAAQQLADGQLGGGAPPSASGNIQAPQSPFAGAGGRAGGALGGDAQSDGTLQQSQLGELAGRGPGSGGAGATGADGAQAGANAFDPAMEGGGAGTDGGQSAQGANAMAASGGAAGNSNTGQSAIDTGGGIPTSSDISAGNGTAGSSVVAAEMKSSHPAPSAAQSLAAQRGVDWALNLASRNSAPITRPVQAIIRVDSIEVLPSRTLDAGAARGATEVRLDQPTEDAVDDLVAAVRVQIDNWGLAGQGLHWKPVIVLSVAPGAEHNAQKLAQLLVGSGIDVRLPQTARAATTEGPHATH